ncbi:uncharacterized protein LOC131614639 [Vicia villosa]|uniref:uncharacterized protein LOC131614639 n=1 Tax=Vicia villosa TaxID=3911 RepID=UPI00273C21BC|nr:uncharacterized protein LOC131614639 [Vicia villosa]
MYNKNHGLDKGKEKVNKESVTNLKTMESQQNKKKQKGMAEEESNVQSKKNFCEEIFPFLLFGFIIDPTKGNQKAYSCNFYSRKFITPQAKGGHQNCHKSERKLKKNNETMKKAWELFSNGNHVRCQYQYYEFDIMNQKAIGSSSFNAQDLHCTTLEHIPHIDQDNVSRQVTMTENDFDLVSEGGVDSNVDHEHKVTHKEETSKDTDLNLKL